MKNGDMPAMPFSAIGDWGKPVAFGGLTKREEFASRNMAAILANGNYEAPRRHRFTGMAKDALAAADALLAAIEAEQSELARHQPCGCVICTCEHDEQCQGCGAKNCGTHPAGEIPAPVFRSKEAQS